MAVASFGLTWPEIVGILSSLVSGSGAIIVMILAVRKAKRETRAKADRDCLERIERMMSGASAEPDK